MALTINTNTSALQAIHRVNQTQRNLGRSMSRVSSGLRIAEAGDDAAGLGVANNLETLSSSSKAARRNVNDGLSIISTSEGATHEVLNILQRMRGLAIQGASDTLASSEKRYLQEEADVLVREIDRVASHFDFNGLTLLDGGSTLSVQVGADQGETISVSFGDLSLAALGIGAMSFTTQAGSTSAVSTIDQALSTLQGYITDYGAGENQLSAALETLGVYTENLLSSEATIRSADFAMETSTMARHQILQQAGLSVLAQANQLTQGVQSLL